MSNLPMMEMPVFYLSLSLDFKFNYSPLGCLIKMCCRNVSFDQCSPSTSRSEYPFSPFNYSIKCFASCELFLVIQTNCLMLCRHLLRVLPTSTFIHNSFANAETQGPRAKKQSNWKVTNLSFEVSLALEDATQLRTYHTKYN